MESSGYTLRPINLGGDSDDLALLCELYASTRVEELSQTGWPDEKIAAFLTQQFEAQHTHYQKHYPTADFDLIISAEGESIGRLYIDEWETEFRIIDIALFPQWRGRGIGSDLLAKVINRAFAVGKAVSIHVEQYNPAMKLYLRLGFEMVEEQGVYHLMKLTPKTQI